MPLFNIPKRQSKEADLAIVKKGAEKQANTALRGSNSIYNRIAEIKALVGRNLGKYADDYIVITDKDALHEYMSHCLENNVVAIDTETTGLDPLLDKIVGLCLYTPNEKPAYVPINHVSYITGALVDNQLPVDIISGEVKRLTDSNVDIIMFNANFDIRVIRNQLKVDNIYCTWDCFLAARCMNENEPDNKLKKLHQKYVLDGAEDELAFDEMFKGISFGLIPVSVAYLYAAHDAIITYELYEFQKQFVFYDPEKPHEDRNGMNGVSWVFFNIEMPCIDVVTRMEDTGVLLDLDYAKKLSEKYHKALQEKLDSFYAVCAQYESDIERYKEEHPNHKLSSPINIASPSQISVLLYDIIGVESVDKKNPRGTGESILQKIDNPICKAILDYREVAKLISTYIDKLPECINPNDKRVHCSFNQYGADTGRFSSSDPNLQNLPSHAKDIRPMFVATHYNKQVDFDTDEFLEVDKFTELQTDDGWVKTSTLSIGDKLSIDGNVFTISDIEIGDSTAKIFL